MEASVWKHFEGLYAMQMLYSAKSNWSSEFDAPWGAPSEAIGLEDGGWSTQSNGVRGLKDSRGKQRNASVAAVKYPPTRGQEKAQPIGMTCGLPIQKFKLTTGLVRGGLAALLLGAAGLTLTPAAQGQSAATWNKRGQDAELRQDYDTAYEDYLKAHDKKPADMRYTARVDRMRFQAAAQHVDRGRVLRQSGDIAGALNQFTRALQIDPGNEAAQQEIQITQRQDSSAGASLTPPPGSAESRAVLKDLGDVSAPMTLKPLSNDPITLHMVEDVKNIYTAIGKAAGLNVLFDPDLPTKRIAFDVSNVNVSEALRILGISAVTFYKVVTPDTVFVAASTREKHTALDDVAVQTFFLTNAAGQADANEVVAALRNVLDPSDKVYLVLSQNAIVVRAPPEHLVLAEKLLNDLDRTRPEVVVDVAILEVNRDKIRNLGITLPQSFGLTPQASNANNTTTSSTTTNTTTQTAGITLNTLGNLNATNFSVSLGGGTVNALLSDTDTRVLQNPSMRATDGQDAKLKIGQRIPIATGSYSAGAATGITAGIGVQTQFTYIDVGVVIDMLPTVHLDREVSLKMDVAVSTEAGQQTISGVTEPIIGQRQSTSTIQLRDGEPCLLAGILTKEDNNTLSGTPGLASIPFLKYLFGSTYKETDQDEVVFILIPHIVRESVLTPINTRAIDTGTQTTIELRRSDAPIDKLFPESAAPPPATTTTAANAATAMAQQMRQQAMPPTQGPMGSGAATAANNAAAGMVAAGGQPVTLSITPPNSAVAQGSTFTTSVVLTNGQDVFAVPMQIQFDPKVLQLVNVDAGKLLSGDGQPVALVHRDEGNGLVTINASRPPGASGVNGQGEVCTLTFKAIGAGDSSIALVKVGARTSSQANLPAVGSQGMVHVK
jgi:general secretion pathway protein D